MALAEHVHSDSKINEQLQRIVADSSFQSTPQLRALLTYLVETALTGQLEELKAAAIAKAVFKRDDSFDSQTDTIVRVEAGRLRRRLAQYYKDDGLNDPLVIDIPKGGYAPRFSEPATPTPESARIPQIAGEAESSVPIRPTAPVGQPARKWIALLTLGLVFVLFLWWRGEGETSVPVELSSPFIMVMPMAHQGSAIGRQTADRSVQAVISKLAKLDSISVMAYRSSMELAADSPSLTSLRADQRVSHVLDGQLEIQLDEVHAQMEIVATDTGEAVWSENIVGVERNERLPSSSVRPHRRRALGDPGPRRERAPLLTPQQQPRGT